MASLTSQVGVRDPQTGQGGGGLPPRTVYGGGENRGGDGFPDYEQRLRRARMGLLLAMAPIIMMFLAFTTAYIVRKGSGSSGESITDAFAPQWLYVKLPVGLLLVNTVLLLLGSVTIDLARRTIAREVKLSPVRSIPGVSLGDERTLPWLAITVVLGFGFLMGQWIAWRELGASGFYLATSASSSFVYLLTAAHGVHLLGGLLVLLYSAVAALRHRPVESRLIILDVTAWYWHFMALLWIYIFALLRFAQ